MECYAYRVLTRWFSSVYSGAGGRPSSDQMAKHSASDLRRCNKEIRIVPLIQRRVYKQTVRILISHLIVQTCVPVSPAESVSVTVRRVAGLVSRPKIGQVASIQFIQLNIGVAFGHWVVWT